MNLPAPYAFNYHFPNSVFRAFAFTNFTNYTEIIQVIRALNSKGILGRKLKVEYKKARPSHR